MSYFLSSSSELLLLTFSTSTTPALLLQHIPALSFCIFPLSCFPVRRQRSPAMITKIYVTTCKGHTISYAPLRQMNASICYGSIYFFFSFFLTQKIYLKKKKQLRTQIVNGTCANGKFTNWQREREKTRNGSRRDDVKKLPF